MDVGLMQTIPQTKCIRDGCLFTTMHSRLVQLINCVCRRFDEKNSLWFLSFPVSDTREFLDQSRA